MQEWEKVSGTKKVNRFRPPEVRAALANLELARERLHLAADQVCLLDRPAPACITLTFLNKTYVWALLCMLGYLSRDAVGTQAWKAFMRDFGSLYPHFRAAVQALASLDALQSLASLAIMPE